MAARVLAPERMDDPSLEPSEHRRALRALATVNRLSLAAGRVWREVVELEREGVTPVRVLDVACGGGDVLVGVERARRRAGIDVVLHGCDLSDVALEDARLRATGAPSLGFFRLDALRDELPAGYHLVCSSLFLHHLERDDAVRLLERMADATTHKVLIQDLRRTRLGEALARTTLRVVTTSSVARSDGPKSVRAAFTIAEAAELCRDAGLVDADVRRCWPQRFTIRWRRPGLGVGATRAGSAGDAVVPP
ncbi:MAG: methyltransferase domain-containing protein [Gemmatimonadota bacterium]